MITTFFPDLNRSLRIRIHKCCDCGIRLEFRTWMKSYYCRRCKKHISLEKGSEFTGIMNLVKDVKIDTYTGIVDIKAWKS